MTTHDTRSQLLAEIAASPEDDTLRLAFADWLDEQPTTRTCPICRGTGEGVKTGAYSWRVCECGGTGTVPDTAADRDRAEFVRLDVERHRRWPDFARVCEADRPTAYADWRDLAAIEKRLLYIGTAHPVWSRCPCPECVIPYVGATVSHGAGGGRNCLTCDGTGDLFLRDRRLEDETLTEDPQPRTVTFSPGFPDSVTCTLAEAFAADGTPTPWALAVVRLTPVVRFRLTDRAPQNSIRYPEWFRWYVGADRDEIPSALFDELEGEFPTPPNGDVIRVPYWRGAAAAVDALALAAGRIVRRHAYKERT